MSTRTLFVGALVAAVAIATAAIAAIASGAAAPARAGTPPDAATVYREWGERFGAGDKAGWMSYWADDGIITDVGSKSNAIVGKDAIAFIFDSIVAGGLDAQSLELSVDGDQLTERAEWSDSQSDAAGVSRYIALITATISDGKIHRFDLRYDATDAQTRTYVEYLGAQPNVPFPGSTEFALVGTQPATAWVAGLGDITFVEIHTDAPGSGTLVAARVQRGSCGSSGDVLWPLAGVLNGASFTILSTPASALESQASIHVGDVVAPNAFRDVACGVVPAAAPPAAPPPAPVPAAPPAQPVIAPNTGSGAGSAREPLAPMAAALVALGAIVTATGLALRARR